MIVKAMTESLSPWDIEIDQPKVETAREVFSSRSKIKIVNRVMSRYKSQSFQKRKRVNSQRELIRLQKRVPTEAVHLTPTPWEITYIKPLKSQTEQSGTRQMPTFNHIPYKHAKKHQNPELKPIHNHKIEIAIKEKLSYRTFKQQLQAYQRLKVPKNYKMYHNMNDHSSNRSIQKGDGSLIQKCSLKTIKIFNEELSKASLEQRNRKVTKIGKGHILDKLLSKYQ